MQAMSHITPGDSAAHHTHPDTLAVHGPAARAVAEGTHVPTIDLSTTYPLPEVESGGDSYELLAGGGRAKDGATSLVYQRLWSPNASDFEEGLAALEGAESAVSFATGMAAICAVLQQRVAAGKPHIVAIRPLYGGTDHVLATGFLGTRVTWATLDTVTESIESDTGLVIMESPANPTLELVDIAAVVAAAGDVPVMVDNTFATPVLQQPLAHGAAYSVHSATKYLGGHGDAMGGIVACSEERARQLRGVRSLTGGLLHPMGAYMLARGLRTLPIRIRQQQENAQAVAEALDGHEAIARVFFPGLDGQDPAGLVGSQMAGPGAMLALDMAGGYQAAAAFAERTRLAVHAVSLGGVDTLIQHPASLTHRPVAPDARPAAGVVRVSIGLEDPRDIIADFTQALS